jgi:serine/threonine-protein kinase
VSDPLPSDRWQRITDLFSEALAVEPARRSAWLDAHCGADAALRREVESLLGADAPPGADATIVDVVGLAIADASSVAESVGVRQRVGPYRIIREIGHGGMATVFLAARDDDEFNQLVAIKVVRGALGIDALRRFRAERQILASLDHPSIARLLDGGATPDGLPYLVMEYVIGMPIDQYCDEQHLAIADRLRLFTKVCEAVTYAHRSLVVHRDIKPSNILVTPEGLPKLLDFGIAKLLDDESPIGAALTKTGMRALTPEYASPEQVRGEPITTASDVYSLGVLLYELMTGSRPLAFATQQPGEVERVVCTVEPRKPSTVPAVGHDARELAGDLDTIALTALQKEPQRRYQSASHLADDIERYLSERPIVARPATWRYRSSRFVRRHRAGVAAVGVMVALIIGFVIALAFQMRRVSRERDTAQQVSDLLLELYSSFDPSESRGSRVTAQDVLDRGAARIQAELKDQPEVQARMLDAIGGLYLDVGLPDRAIDVFDASLSILKTVGREDTLEAAKALGGIANAYRERARIAEAEALARQALEIRRRLAGPRAPETADSLNTLGVVLYLQGQTIEGASLVGESVDIWRQTKGPDSPEFGSALMNLVRFWRERADYLTTERFARSDLLKAEKFERERLGIRRKTFGDAHPLTTNSLASLGLLLRIGGRAQEAEPLLRESLALRRQLYGGNRHASVIEAMNNLAFALQDLGQYDEAGLQYRTGAEAMQSTPALAAHPQRAIDLANYATLLELSGRLDEAEAAYREAIALRRHARGDDHPGVARTLDHLANLLLKRNRAPDALSVADEALAIRRSKLGDGHYETAVSMVTRAKVLAALGRRADAAPLLQAGHAIRAAVLPKDDPRLLDDARLLSDLH